MDGVRLGYGGLASTRTRAFSFGCCFFRDGHDGLFLPACLPAGYYYCVAGGRAGWWSLMTLSAVVAAAAVVVFRDCFTARNCYIGMTWLMYVLDACYMYLLLLLCCCCYYWERPCAPAFVFSALLVPLCSGTKEWAFGSSPQSLNALHSS